MHELKKCNSCGNTYPGKLSFCLNCGSPLVQLDTMIGTVLDGRYRLDSLIGVGGMGDVYRAMHIHLDSEVAVKLLKPEFVSNQTAIKRFRLEAKAAGRIHHPNAVRVTDFGVTTEGIVYLVMELVQGESLRNLIRSEKKLDELRAINIVRQVCGAVEAAHRSGVIHRDLKPDNIIIETVQSTERVKVLDFGIAKLREAKTDSFLTQAGTIIGTPQYMSPEQCQGLHLDPRSDIYSIGILLYEMLTGEVPFDGQSTLQVVYDQLHALPRPLRELSPQVSSQVAQVIMRSLEKEPDKRQSSATLLSEELKRAVQSESEESPYSMAEPFLVAPLKPVSEGASKRETPSGEQRNPFPSLGGERPYSTDRSTSALPRSDSDPDALTTVREKGRPTSPGQKVPTAEGRNELALDSDEPVKAAKNKTLLIALAAAVLLVVIVAIIFFSGKTDEQKVSDPPPPKTPTGMALIQGGKFLMGRNDGSSDEGPVHEVEVKSFFLDTLEVTNQEYKRFVDATGRQAPRHWKFGGSFAPDEASLPVTFVSWDDASAYAKWAGKRLPTEAEWEYAARGGSKGFLYPWGNQWQQGNANVDRKGLTKPAPVRTFDKDLSPFGIYDLAGNVSEWVQDFYSEKYGAKPDEQFRIYRGGNFLDPPERGTNTYRWYDYPALTRDVDAFRVGFRCAKDLEQ